jgi:hypothetical protein
VSQPETPSPSPQPQYPPPSGSLGGCALFVLGLLFLIPSGLCTAIGGVGLVAQLSTDPAELSRDFDEYIGFVILTLVCLAIGIGLVWAGVRVHRH